MPTVDPVARDIDFIPKGSYNPRHLIEGRADPSKNIFQLFSVKQTLKIVLGNVKAQKNEVAWCCGATKKVAKMLKFPRKEECKIWKRKGRNGRERRRERGKGIE